MSSDLFAAFGSPALVKEEQPTNRDGEGLSEPDKALHPSSSLSLNDMTINDDDDDDFGDFEDASDPVVIDLEQDQVPAARIVKNGECAPKQKPLPFSSPPPKRIKHQEGRHPFADHMDLLFSADDDDNDDYNAGADEMMDLATNPEAAMEYSKRIIAQQQAERDEQEKAQAALVIQAIAAPAVHSDPQSGALTSSYQVRASKLVRDPNVLFDAEDPSEVEDDEFGDFEAGEIPLSTRPEQVTPQTRTADSLAHYDEPAASLNSAPKQQDQHSPDRGKPLQSRSRGSKISNTRGPDLEIFNDDVWDDFEDGLPSFDNSTASSKLSDSHSRPTAAILPVPAKAHTESGLPPTNVPPPSVLLSIFPRIFTQASEALFTPLSKASANERHILISHPASRKFLSNYLGANIVLGHIIAGRKLRWKRDQYLAQGMRIGPAVAGGKGGMKLAGVDKSEVAREDREVLDVVRSWKSQIGKVRSAITALNAIKSSGMTPKLPTVPYIAESLPVKVLKATEGGFTAPHACALCGLKREERVGKVDVDVDDSFGEWWVNSMSMHLTCKDFWHEHEGLLRSR